MDLVGAKNCVHAIVEQQSAQSAQSGIQGCVSSVARILQHLVMHARCLRDPWRLDATYVRDCLPHFISSIAC